MIAYPYAALLTGVLLILAAGLLLARHYLLDPAMTRYPKAPPLALAAMFLFAAVLMFVGLKFLWAFISGAPDAIPPQPAPSTQMIAMALVIYKAAMLINVIKQRLPAATWARLNAIQERLRCAPDAGCPLPWRRR